LVPASQSSEVVRFGPFEANRTTGELRKHGIKLKLQELPFRLLVSLLERPGEVVTREELQAKLWPEGTFVDFERGLGTALNKVREALGDSAASPRFIETIPRRGYRFLGEVETNSAPHLEATAPPVQRARKYALASAVAIALAVGAAYAWYRTQAKPLTDQDVLVLADFTNSTGDPVFDGTLREALAFQLEQSPFLKVLDDEVMRQDLRLMGRSPQEHVTNDLAHDICVREADKAMLGGSIASLGKSYAIELKAANCQTGATLARQQAEAADKEHVLQAIATAAQRMRAKLGESLSSIRKLAPPFDSDRVTTSSLEAFQAYSSGAELYRQGRYSEAVTFLQRATELDANLAPGWNVLALAYYNSGGSRERFEEYQDRGWTLRDRVSAQERFWITSGRGTLGENVAVAETWARTYPRDSTPVVVLGRIHADEGEFDEALAKFQEAYRLQARRAIDVIDLVMMYTRLDRFDEAKAVAEKMFARGEDAPMLHRQLLAIAYAQADQDSAAKQIEWFTGKPEEYLSLADQSTEARVRGRLRKSRELLQRAADLARRRNLPDAAAGLVEPNPNGDALLGNCDTARKTGAVSEAILALCGSSSLAARAEKPNQRWSPSNLKRNPAQVPLNHAAVELGLGHPARAIELLESVAPYERAYPISNYVRGLAYLRLGKGTEAAAEFQKILDHRGSNWGPLYPLSYVGLARATALAGDTARARKAYEAFFTLWKDADPDVRVLIEARKEYAAFNR
jgi:DNA-binding winged helix-turn-helix (wHTH) protein/tetratricopeptide (TPR) repeat protein